MELYPINEEHYLFLSLRIIKVDHCLKESPAHCSIVLGEGGGGLQPTLKNSDEVNAI